MIFECFPVGRLQCNCSIVGDEATREAMVIDPGDNIPQILGRLAKHGLTLKQIVITHGHIDHVGGALKLKQATGAPVLMNEKDMELLNLMDEQANFLGLPETPEVAAPDVSAEDGMVVGIANHAAQVIYTPGHTPGSICLHFAPEKLLIAGDTLFEGGIGRTDLWGGNGRQIISSIHDRLLVLPEETVVIPGHGYDTTIGAEKVGNPFLGGRV